MRYNMITLKHPKAVSVCPTLFASSAVIRLRTFIIIVGATGLKLRQWMEKHGQNKFYSNSTVTLKATCDLFT